MRYVTYSTMIPLPPDVRSNSVFLSPIRIQYQGSVVGFAGEGASGALEAILPHGTIAGLELGSDVSKIDLKLIEDSLELFIGRPNEEFGFFRCYFAGSNEF